MPYSISKISRRNLLNKDPRDSKRFKMVSTISKMERTQQIQNSCNIYFFWKILKKKHVSSLNHRVITRKLQPFPTFSRFMTSRRPAGPSRLAKSSLRAWWPWWNKNPRHEKLKNWNKLLYLRFVLHFLESKDYCIFGPPSLNSPRDSSTILFISYATPYKEEHCFAQNTGSNLLFLGFFVKSSLFAGIWLQWSTVLKLLFLWSVFIPHLPHHQV